MGMCLSHVSCLLGLCVAVGCAMLCMLALARPNHLYFSTAGYHFDDYSSEDDVLSCYTSSPPH